MGLEGFWRARIAQIVLGLAISGSVAYAQTPPAKPEPLLGRVHLWAKIGRMDIDHAATTEWGVDREGYFGLELYGGARREFYWGGEVGGFGAGETVAQSGKTIRDFNFWWLELNGKKAFGLKHGCAIAVGAGVAYFYLGGNEVSTSGGVTFSDPLADIGFGSQGFVEVTWRRTRLLLGLDAKYQRAFDFVDLEYSNLRLGAHLGVAF